MFPSVLIVLPGDVHIRNTVSAGAFDALEGKVWFTAENGVGTSLVEHLPGWLGTLPLRAGGTRDLERMELVLRAARTRRSRTLKLKTALLPRATRLMARAAATPPARSLVLSTLAHRAGNADPRMERLVRQLGPDLVIAVSGGNDPLVFHAVVAARAAGATSLVVMHNWDGLSSKGALAAQPDHVAVWSRQTAEHAVRIHRLEPERVHVVGSPSLDGYTRLDGRIAPPPFPTPYVLVAGCYAPFAERDLVIDLATALRDHGRPERIVYRPHPYRAPRSVDDRLRESDAPGVLIDPDVERAYRRSFESGEKGLRERPERFPELDSYPPRLHHASAVVCPLSTMVLEAALMRCPVVAAAYDDGFHPLSPATVARFDHFDRVEQIPGVTVARTRAAMTVSLLTQLRSGHRPQHDAAALGWWVHTDDRTFAQRLAELVVRVAHRPAHGPMVRA